MKTRTRYLLLVPLVLLAGCLDSTAPRIPTPPDDPTQPGRKKTGYVAETAHREVRPAVLVG